MGGGPAGSSAATVLAERGYDVVLIEKAHHPRFHIGESLLPANLPLFERLGVAAQVRAIGMEKYGAEFTSCEGRHQKFEFADAWDKSFPLAYQVRRSELDEILIRRAGQAGARVIEGCRARHAVFAADGRSARVDVAHDIGGSESFEARYLIDATGRDTFLGQSLDAKRRNKRHNSAAMYAHFTGARRTPGKCGGNIGVYWFDHGWFWFIPLAERLCDAALSTEVEATGNYAYSCDHSHGANYLLVGDAYTFIDPVFSTGVMLAMASGEAAALTIDEVFRRPERMARALKRFDRLMRHGPKHFSWFIYRVTNPAMRELFLDPANVLRMKEALLSLLAGDIFGRTPIWGRLRAFKGTYYLLSLVNLGRSLRAARLRAANIRPVEAESPTG